MWHKLIELDQLTGLAAWKFERFRSAQDELPNQATEGVPLSEVVTERQEFADPMAATYLSLPYLGLDAVEPGTGEVLTIRSASEQSIRSRSRVFREGDVLYGRLRAYLNKVACIDESLSLGTCSGEFFVLEPDTTRVLPRFLQWLLLSDRMVSYVKLRLAGATHPRLGIDDLLSYRVLLPSLKRQTRAIAVLEEATMLRRRLREELRQLPAKTSERASKIAYS